MGCSPERLKRINKLQKIKDMWFDKDTQLGRNIFKVAGDDPAYFTKFYEGEVQSDFHYGDVPSMQKLKRLERKVKKFGNQMGKKPGSFAKWFYLPENVLKNNPIMENLYDLMIDPATITKGNRTENRKKYGTALLQAAEIWHKNMAPKLWKVLNEGIHDYISVLESNQTALGIEKGLVDKIKENLLVKNEKTGKYEMAKQKNYFPTQILDIIPAFNELTENMWSGDAGKRIGNVTEYIDRVTKDIGDNLKLDGNVYERGGKSPTRVSKNVVSVIDQYAKGATRFNFSARVSREVTKALRDLQKLEGQDMDDHLAFLADYIKDTHSAALGLDMKQSKFGKISRAITSWQFMSKLGFNVRGAARNATQSLQNWVWFGWKGIREYQQFSASDALKISMEAEMNRHGIFYTNLEELAMPAEFLPSTKMIDGKLVEVSPGVGEKFTHGLEKLAKKSGWMMQTVENRLNRSLTFKIAYSKMYNELLANKDFIAKDIEKSYAGKELEAAVIKKIQRKSGRFAAIMVKELHYEYSPFAKPKALRTAPGAVLGQFSTYSINFFEYQRKILAEGGRSVLGNDWNSADAWRMYRLGMMYTAVDAIISPLFSTDLGKLIQNDTKDRAAQLYTWFTGNEAERKKVFFGKGPAIGTFGGPFVSDLITIGQLTNFMKMNESDMMSYMAGYQDYSQRTKDDKIFEVARLLNTQIARTAFSTAPKVVNGTGIMTLLSGELGLYGSKEVTDGHTKLFKNARKVAPDLLDQGLTPLSEKQKIAKGYSRAMKGQTPNKRNLSDEDMQKVLRALAKLQN